MRRWLCVSALALLLAVPASAAQPKCPLDIETCLNQFGRMRDRPWLGIEIDTDSLGVRVIQGVVKDGPAERAGIKAGDRLERIEGLDPGKWFAGKAGWKTGQPTALTVERDGHPVELSVTPGRIPEDYLARAIGVHMIEAHLAYSQPGEHQPR